MYASHVVQGALKICPRVWLDVPRLSLSLVTLTHPALSTTRASHLSASSTNISTSSKQEIGHRGAAFMASTIAKSHLHPAQSTALPTGHAGGPALLHNSHSLVSPTTNKPHSPRKTREVKDEEDERHKDDDDDVGEIKVEGEVVEDGEFFYTPYHLHKRIQPRDVGSKVMVGESVVSEAQRLLGLSRVAALKLLQRKALLNISDTAILKTLRLLHNVGVTAARLRRSPWLLLHSAENYEERLPLLTGPHLFHSVCEGLGFCHFTPHQIETFQHQFQNEASTFMQHPNRIYYIADQLQVDVGLLTERIVKTHSILSMDISRINHLISVFREYDVRPEDVVSDLTVFCYLPRVTEKRLREAREAGCVNLKPWICRAKQDNFDRFLERQRALLDLDGTNTEYLETRLGCTRAELDQAFSQTPSLGKLHPVLLRAKLDLLLDHGFTTEDIRKNLRVLLFAERRIEERIKMLREIGWLSPSVALLTCHKRTFLRAILGHYRKLRMEIEGKKEEEDRCSEFKVERKEKR